jgi:hypothetical protein
MHLFFLDDSGTILPPNKLRQNHFVLAGPIIPEEQWSSLHKKFSEICCRFNIVGEIKWRFFGQRGGHEDRDNTLAHLNINEKDALRTALLNSLIANESIKMIAVIIHVPTAYKVSSIKKPEQVHAYAYKSLVELFQLHLQGLSQIIGSTVNGIIIGDHRSPMQDAAQRNLHMELLKSKNNSLLSYPNLIEGLFFSPSHHSVGIQFADLISGAVFRYYEHQDTRWYNLLRKNFWEPKPEESKTLTELLGYRKEKDAESAKSFNLTEPT